MSKHLRTIENGDTHGEEQEGRKSGRAAFDGDGRGVWEWQVSTGVFTRTVTEDQLMELAQCNLELIDDVPHGSDQGRCIYQPASGADSTGRSGSNTRSITGTAAAGTVQRLFTKLRRVV